MLLESKDGPAKSTFNYRIAAVENTSRAGASRYEGSYSKPTASWPVGDYRVTLSIDGKIATQAGFKVAR